MTMDRRQRKTREAIFRAFTNLISQKPLSRITVEQLITEADIGRATFYAHFETKDALVEAFCQELFCHIFDANRTTECSHRHIFSCDAPDSVFLHLFRHLQKNDNHILSLLSCPNNELFLRCFKEGLGLLIQRNAAQFAPRKSPRLPEDLWLAHIASVFVETLNWWIEKGMQPTAETVTEYFLLLV